MSTSSIGSNSDLSVLIATLQAAANQQAQQTGSAGTATSIASSITTPPQDSAQLSPVAQLMAQLQQLQQSNPTEFKQVTVQIAQNLQQAARQQTGPQAQALQQMASQFQQASQTGQMPGPSTGGGGGHHHHHHGGGGGGTDLATLLQNAIQPALPSISDPTGTTTD